jgi:hypothetical protein
MRDTDNLSGIDSQELHACDVWAGYIGGQATHTWSDNDWRRVADFPKLPIYVSRVGKTGTYCGLEAIMAIYKLGIPRGSAIVADVELLSGDIAELINWTTDFREVLDYFGYHVWPYGSTSYLFDIPMFGGYWVATDSKVEEQYHHPGVHATQYLFGESWDTSLIHRHIVHAQLHQNWGINHSV